MLPDSSEAVHRVLVALAERARNGKKRLTGEQFLVALGSSPIVPDFGGIHDVPYLTSDLLTSQEAPEITELPASLIIVGGYIAVELGQMFRRLGSQGGNPPHKVRITGALQGGNVRGRTL